VKKVPEWKKWAFTDGSCQVHQRRQVKRQGYTTLLPAYPDLDESLGMGFTSTISRAAITAVILHGHSYIATDSLVSPPRKKRKKRKTKQAIEHPTHQLSKGGHIVPKHHMPNPHQRQGNKK